MKMLINGGQIPRGQISVSGAKNAATPLMAAALLTDGRVALSNFPTELVDAREKARHLELLGVETHFDRDNDELRVNASAMHNAELPSYSLPVRTTYLLAAASLMRFGHARVPYPGGCKLGTRGYDVHVMVWEKFGCVVEEKPGYIQVKCDKLEPAEIHFPISTVGGTENALLCAAVTAGRTLLHNAYVTPEIANMIALLRLMGANIELEGTSKIVVEGKSGLHGGSIRVIPDRIEALTWMVFATLTGGTILLDDVPFKEMEIPLLHLRAAGIDYFSNSHAVYLGPMFGRHQSLQPFELACGTHPGIISDMQPFYVLLGLKADGNSLVVDYRYPERLAYLSELTKFVPGSIEWKPGQIRIHGPGKFKGAVATSTDLRGSMALVIAAFLAPGESTVSKVEMALRGYNNLQQKLKTLGLHCEIEDEA